MRDCGTECSEGRSTSGVDSIAGLAWAGAVARAHGHHDGSWLRAHIWSTYRSSSGQDSVESWLRTQVRNSYESKGGRCE